MTYRVSRQDCSVCERETLHTMMKCNECGTLFVLGGDLWRRTRANARRKLFLQAKRWGTSFARLSSVREAQQVRQENAVRVLRPTADPDPDMRRKSPLGKGRGLPKIR